MCDECVMSVMSESKTIEPYLVYNRAYIALEIVFA